MPNKSFRYGQTSREAVGRDLQDFGIHDPHEWSHALDLETPELKEPPYLENGGIEDRSWQRGIDTAFIQGDYHLFKALKDVRPESVPSPELVRRALDNLVVSRPKGLAMKIGKINSMSPVEADPNLLRQEFEVLLEKFSQDVAEQREILNHLNIFMNVIGYHPPPEIVQTCYRNLLTKKAFEVVSFGVSCNEVLFMITKIKPDASVWSEALALRNTKEVLRTAHSLDITITKEMIDEAYKIAFEKNGPEGLMRLIARINHEVPGGGRPSDELVQNAYQEIFKKDKWYPPYSWISAVKNLKNLTNIEPVFTKETKTLMQPFFEEYISNSSHYSDLRQFIELTGVQPDVNLVQRRALKIMDDTYGSRTQGMKGNIELLSNTVKIEFEISESEIQNRYQQALEKRDFLRIISLYNAFEIKPTIDRETARQFMIELMGDIDNASLRQLEHVFGMTLDVTEEELEKKQDENLENLRFNNLAIIQDLTGKECDPKKLEHALIQLIKETLANPSLKYSAYGPDWSEIVKQRLEQFGVVLKQEDVIPIYQTLFQEGEIDPRDIEHLLKLTGIPIPHELVQQAYVKILSPEYVPANRGNLFGEFSDLYRATGIAPQVSETQVQAFYLRQLDSNQGNSIQIKRIFETTKIQPVFDPEDVNKIYKNLIQRGRAPGVKSIIEMTGVKLQLDEETSREASQQFETNIEIASSDYFIQKEPYASKGFVIRMKELREVTGIQPDTEKMQSTYSKILAEDPHWVRKIKLLVDATGIQPAFSPEMLQTKSQEFLVKRELDHLQILKTYGTFTFTPEEIEQVYADFLVKNLTRDQDENGSYPPHWFDAFEKLQNITGIPPTETQLGKLIVHVYQNPWIRLNHHAQSRLLQAQSFIKNIFEMTDFTEETTKRTLLEFMGRARIDEMFEIVKQTGVQPNFTEEELLPQADRLFRAEKIYTLTSLKQKLHLDIWPVTDAVVQETYASLLDQEPFDRDAFYAIYKLSGKEAILNDAQLNSVYRKSLLSQKWIEKTTLNTILTTIESVTGSPMPPELIQEMYLEHLIADHPGLKKVGVPEMVSILSERYGKKISPEVISKAVTHFIEQGEIKEIKDLIAFSGIKPDIHSDTIQAGFKGAVDNVVQATEKNPHRAKTHHLTEWFSYLNETFQIPPSPENKDYAYEHLIGYPAGLSEGKNVKDSTFWDYLKKHFGPPSREAIQRMYLAQLNPIV